MPKKQIFNLHNTGDLSERYLNWTKQAIDCYNRHCICKGCLLNKVLENKCFMKKTVLKIYELHGAPPVEEEIDIKEVIDYINEGYLIKDIAKIYGKKKNSFTKFLKSHGINGHYLEEFRKKNKKKK